MTLLSKRLLSLQRVHEIARNTQRYQEEKMCTETIIFLYQIERILRPSFSSQELYQTIDSNSSPQVYLQILYNVRVASNLDDPDAVPTAIGTMDKIVEICVLLSLLGSGEIARGGNKRKATSHPRNYGKLLH